MELVIRNYWWSRVIKDIGKSVKGCDTCQRMKNRTETPAGKLMTNEVSEKLWTHLTVNFITKLLLIAGKNTILVVCNRLLKITHFIATIEGTLVEELARLFRDNVWKLHGLLECMISDRGPQFVAELIKKLNKILEIETKLSTVFHPQIDRQIEQMNQELEQYLRFFTEYRQKDWPEWLATVEFAVNNKIHTTTKVLPFIANYGRELKMGADIRRKEKVEKMKKVQEKSGAALRKS